MPSANDESILSLRDILRILFKRQGIIALLTVAALAGSAVVVFLMPPTYESEAHILVRHSMPEAEEPSLATDQHGVPNSYTYRQVNQSDEMNTAISVVKSRDLVVEVMDRMSLTREQFDRVPDFRRYVRMSWRWIKEMASTIWNETKYFLRLSPRPSAAEIKLLKRERFVSDVVDAVVVNQMTDSDVLRVGFRVSDPVLAYNFAKKLSEMSIVWHNQKYRQSGSVAFFGEQVEKAGADLEALQKQLAETRHKLKLIGVDDKRRLIIENTFKSQMRLNEIVARQDAISAGIREIKELLSNEAQMVTLSKTTEINPLREQISEKVSALELQRAENAEKFTEHGRIIHDLDATLAAWRSDLGRLPAKREGSVVEGVNVIQQSLRQKLVDLEIEGSSLKSEETAVRNNLDAYNGELEALNKGAYRVEDLERLVRTQAAVYEQYLKSSELSRVTEAKQLARMANLNIVQAAALPISPIKPKKWMIIPLAGGCGLLLGLAWAFVTEMNDSTFNSGVDFARALAVESLTTFPALEEDDLESLPTAVPRPFKVGAGILWGRITRVVSGETPLVVFVSSSHGEGVTTVMLQAALAAAESKSVLVVDGAASAAITGRYGLQRQLGLSDYAHGGDVAKLIHPTDLPGLSVMPFGVKGDKDGLDWAALVTDLRKAGKPVFIDVGALGDSPSLANLLAATDGIILVVAAHVTRREVVEQTLAELREIKSARLLGAVLNRRRFFIPGILYRNA